MDWMGCRECIRLMRCICKSVEHISYTLYDLQYIDLSALSETSVVDESGVESGQSTSGRRRSRWILNWKLVILASPLLASTTSSIKHCWHQPLLASTTAGIKPKLETGHIGINFSHQFWFPFYSSCDWWSTDAEEILSVFFDRLTFGFSRFWTQFLARRQALAVLPTTPG